LLEISPNIITKGAIASFTVDHGLELLLCTEMVYLMRLPKKHPVQRSNEMVGTAEFAPVPASGRTSSTTESSKMDGYYQQQEEMSSES
jgi:hypothetical protein